MARKKLSGNIVKSTLNKHLPKHNNVNYDEIALTLLNEMFEVDKMNDISNILELSNEDKNSINFIINNILSKSNDFKRRRLTTGL